MDLPITKSKRPSYNNGYRFHMPKSSLKGATNILSKTVTVSVTVHWGFHCFSKILFCQDFLKYIYIYKIINKQVGGEGERIKKKRISGIHKGSRKLTGKS